MYASSLALSHLHVSADRRPKVSDVVGYRDPHLVTSTKSHTIVNGNMRTPGPWHLHVMSSCTKNLFRACQQKQ